MSMFRSFQRFCLGLLALCVLSTVPGQVAQAQAYADPWWDTIINGDAGDFNMGRGVNFQCRRGQGDLTVTVAAGGTPNQTTIEFRNGGTFYRSTARKNAQGTYSFTVPSNRTGTLYRLLTGFPHVNINVEAAGPIFVETGAAEGSEGPGIMQDFCSPGRGAGKSLTAPSSATATKVGEVLACSGTAKLRSKMGLGTIQVRLINRTQAQRALYAFDAQGQRQLTRRIGPGQRLKVTTRPGQVWMITDAKGRCRSVLVTRASGDFVIDQ